MSYPATTTRVHGNYLSALVEELASQGVAPDALLPDGVPAAMNPGELAALVRRGAALSDPGLGLRLGLGLNLASHGILGYALMSASHGHQLVSLLTRYAALAIPDLTLSRVLRGDRLLVICRPAADLETRNLFVELVLATLVSTARNLFARPVPGAQAWFDYPPPAHAETFRRLRIPVQFSQAEAALVCDRRFLEQRIDSADPALAELCARQCESLLASAHRQGSTADSVRRMLLGTPHGLPALPNVAERLGMSERTLRRRLDAEGASYRTIRDEVRQLLAERYLTTTSLPVTEIAALLGYRDPANFRRAFRRWTGTSPDARRRAPPGRLQGRDGAPILGK